MTRLVLARFARASVRTLRATPAERVTLCRNGLAELGMLLEYTTPHHSAPPAKRNNSGAEGYRFEPYRAYQLTRDAASYSHSTARITLAERRGRFPDPRDAGTSRCLVIRALNNRQEGQGGGKLLRHLEDGASTAALGRPTTKPGRQSTTTSVPSTTFIVGTRPSVTSARWTTNGNTLPEWWQHSGTVYGIGATPWGVGPARPPPQPCGRRRTG